MNTTPLHRPAVWTPAAALMGLALIPAGGQAAHPLISEDTGTQGAGHTQLEMTGEYGVDRVSTATATSTSLAAVLSLGLAERVDLIFTIPTERDRVQESGVTTSASGHGDLGLDVKWRFLDLGEHVSVAMKTGATTPTGDDTTGLGSGRATYSAYFVATLDPPNWAFNLHSGRIWNRNDLGEREDIWHVSFGGWRQFDKLRVVFDIGRDTNPDPTTREPLGFFIGGLIYSFSDKVDVDLGVKYGLTDAATDRTALAGLTMRY